MNTQNTSKPAIITDNVEAQLKDALHTIHAYLGDYGGRELPAFDKCGPEEYKRLASRLIDALERKVADRKEQEVKQFRAGVRSVIMPHIMAWREAKGQYDAAAEGMPEAMRSYLRPFSSDIQVPVEEMSDVFPAELTTEQRVAKLRAMGFNIGKTAKGAFFVKVEGKVAEGV